jgi:uncharacterized protein YbjT (DUF2867 family)
MMVLVTGATGLLGRYVVQELLDRNYQVRCLVRSPGGERVFQDRLVDVHFGSVLDVDALAAASYGLDAVIHLVGINRLLKGLTFDQVNRLGTANVAAAAIEGGAKHFIYLSAIGATDNRSYPYWQSKWRGEQEVANSGLAHTIVRSSLMFGKGDEFLNTLAGLVRVFPCVPVAGSGRSRFQPIAAADMAKCLVLAIGRDDLKGETIEIGGPYQVSYNDIVGIVARTLGVRRLRFHIPVFLMRLIVAVFQKIQPRPPVTTEQLRMLSIRSVADVNIVDTIFNFTPRSLESNIEYVKSVSFVDGVKIVAGFMPSRIRDH